MKLKLFLCLLLLLFARATHAEDMKINFERDGNTIKIDGHLLLRYPPKLIFEVLTDYEHMHEYVPDMTSSRIMSKEDNKIRVEQKGKSGIGPFKFKFEVVRDVELTLMTEIKSTLVSGNFKSMRTSTKLVQEGDNTRLNYVADMEPDFWVPPLIGSSILKRQVRRQFEAFVAELVKRNQPNQESEKDNVNQ